MEPSPQEALRLRELVSSLESVLAGVERDFFTRHGLCASDLAILLRLARKGPCPVNSLAPRVCLTSGSITTAIQRLRKQGWVATNKDHLDRRLVMVEITPTGVEMAESAKEKRSALLAPLTTGFTPRELKTLSGLLKKLRKSARSPRE